MNQRPNKPHALNPAIALWFQFEYHWRGQWCGAFGDSQHMKLPRSSIPVVLAAVVLISFAISLITNLVPATTPIDRVLSFIHFPAAMAAMLVTPGELLSKDGHPVLFIVVFVLIALLQWYMIFWSIIHLWSWVMRKRVVSQ